MRFQSNFLDLPKTSFDWKELINGQLSNSSLLRCNNCNNPLIQIVLKTTLNNTGCAQIDTVQIFGCKFIAPIFEIITNQISVLNPQTGYTYTWTKNNVPLPGSQTSLNVVSSDVYSLKVNSPNACEIEYSKIQILTDNLELTALDNLRVYPNPAGSHILISGISNESEYQIFDFLGRNKETSQPILNGQISTLNLPNGIYILRISEKGKLKSRVKKFQIQNN